MRALRGWRSSGRADLVAGLAVAAYLIPQCLAYASLAGLEAVSGLWAAMAALVAYAALGTSSRLSVGPESSSALLVGAAVASITAGLDPDLRPAVAAALALAVAGISLVAWAMRLGFLANLLSRPVLVGYMAGVALAMIVSQLPNITGIASGERETVLRAADVLGRIGDVKWSTLAMSLAVTVALFGLQRFRRVPGTLLVVLAATAAAALFGLDDRGLATVGDVPSGLPALALPGVPSHLWPAILAAASGIVVVAYSDNILTARAFAARAGDRIDSDQELLALSGANAAAAVVGGFPVSSSGSRSAVGHAAGGASQLTSVVAAAAVAAVLLFGGAVLESFPLAALGGLVVYAGARLVDLPEIMRIASFRRREAVLVAAAATSVVVFDVLVGIAVAVALSVVELFVRMAHAHDAVQGTVAGLAGFHDVSDYPGAQTLPGLVVYRYDAPLFFANAEDFRTRVTAAIAAEPAPVEWVLVNMEANVEIDLTAVDMLEELRAELAKQGIVLALARVKRDLAVYLDRAGLTARVGPEHIFPTLPTAVEGYLGRDRPPDVTD